MFILSCDFITVYLRISDHVIHMYSFRMLMYRDDVFFIKKNIETENRRRVPISIPSLHVCEREGKWRGKSIRNGVPTKSIFLRGVVFYTSALGGERGQKPTYDSLVRFDIQVKNTIIA